MIIFKSDQNIRINQIRLLVHFKTPFENLSLHKEKIEVAQIQTFSAAQGAAAVGKKLSLYQKKEQTRSLGPRNSDQIRFA